MTTSGRRGKLFPCDEEIGVSEVIGVVLLVSLVVMSISIISLGIVSQPPPKDIPKVELSVMRQGDIVSIYHADGETLEPSSMYIRVNNGQTPILPEDITIQKRDGNITKPWSGALMMGEVLYFDLSLNPLIKDITIFFRRGSLENMILAADISPTPIPEIPVVRIVLPTPTPTGTPSPTPCPEIKADFDSNTTDWEVKFTDKSIGMPIRWKWDFSKGKNSQSSTEQNPIVTLGHRGSWKIVLAVWNSCGESDSIANHINM